MLSDNKTRLIEAALLAAVPICVTITALIAVFVLARV